MDPPVMMNGGDFRSGNSASSLCNFAEILPFHVNFGGNVGNEASFGWGQLSGNSEHNDNNNSGSSIHAYMNNGDHDSVDDPMDLDQRGSNFHSKKRREEDDSPKRVSSSSPSNGNGMARREKISERMKTLQNLVPGCNKVIGKTLVLDEIINYIQALQRQVEFLSMKLEAVTSRSNLNHEGFHSKDLGHQTLDMSFVSQPTREFSRTTSPEWLHMQIGGSFERTT